MKMAKAKTKSGVNHLRTDIKKVEADLRRDEVAKAKFRKEMKVK